RERPLCFPFDQEPPPPLGLITLSSWQLFTAYMAPVDKKYFGRVRAESYYSGRANSTERSKGSRQDF
ncbi:MAG: hypothetical protein QOE57_2551, partial [Acidimicrobiaceae bacterium]|nr:hypothetical protein [Acidimicrobiaceae bacterium]